MRGCQAKLQAQLLIGVRLPPVELYSFDHHAQPYTLDYKWMALYFFPGARAATGSGSEPADADALHHRAFRDHERQLVEAAIHPIGISSQSPKEQLETITANRLCHPILSDPTLELARGVGLPTFSHAGEKCYQGLTLLTKDQVVVWVNYPVIDPSATPRQILTWHQLNSYKA